MFKCPHCEKIFKVRQSLYAHLQSHDELIMKNKKEQMNKILQRKRTNKEQNILMYNTSPNMCKSCNQPLSFERRKNKFCSNSCSATFNNKKRGCKNPPRPSIHPRNVPYTKVELKTCPMCEKLFWSHAAPNKHLPTLCSDKCFILSKKKNATGIKRCTYNGTTFDSKWEAEMARLLDLNHIQWVVPTQGILWIDSTGKQRKYFPDFYIPAFETFLDPKNPIVIGLQHEKLEKVSTLINLIYGKPSDILARLVGVEPT